MSKKLTQDEMNQVMKEGQEEFDVLYSDAAMLQIAIEKAQEAVRRIK